MRWIPTIDQLWVFVAIATPMIVGLTRMGTIDLAYHVRVGELIVRHGIPHVDSFTFTSAGRTWLDQQWGAQVIFALAYRVGGWPGLSLLRAGLMFLTFAPVWLAGRSRGASMRTASIFTVIAFALSIGNLGMRPQMLALPLFTGTMWLVFDRHRHPARLWLVPFMAVAWSNIHGSFVLAPAMLLLASVEDLRRHAPGRRTTAAVTLATIAATFVTPFGLGAWRYALSIASSPTIRRMVMEWAPTSIRNLSGVLFFASAAATAVFMARRKDPVPWSDLMWLTFFFALALPALRGVAWWSLVAPPVVAGLVEHRDRHSIERSGRSPVNVLVLAALIVLFGLMLPWRAPSGAVGAVPQLVDAPEQLVHVTAGSVPVGGRLFVSQAWGSWFEFALPSDPVFVDSRIELFPEDVWDDYTSVMAGRDGWQAILDRWHVDAVVTRARDAALESLMMDDPGWRLAYRDGLGAVFVRA